MPEDDYCSEVLYIAGNPRKIREVLGNGLAFKKQSFLKDGGTCLMTGWQDVECKGPEA